MIRRSKTKLTDYEPKRRNPITLGDDSNIDKDLKVIRVDSKNSILELSENELKVRGTIDASAITVNGASVQTGTDAGATELNELSDVTYSSGDLTIDSLDKIVASGDLTIDADGDIILDPNSGVTKFYRGGDTDDLCTLTVGNSGTTTLATADSDGVVGHLTLQPDGDLVLDPVSQKTIINATDGLYLDGGGDTYIYEAAGDVVRHVVGGDLILVLSEKGDDGNEVNFGQSCAGFTQLEPTYDATTTNVDFRHSNKQFLTFGSGNITSINCIFPLVSGNFVLLLKQDGTGSRTVTNWKAAEFDESAADGSATIKFAGGSNPTLTTDANHVDIISIYWDADNEIAYGVATLDFQF